MSHGYEDEDEPAAELEEREEIDPEDADWNLDPDTTDCPYCGERICEDAQRCPQCGKYISLEDVPWNKPLWLTIGVIVCVIVVLMWVL